MAFQSYAIPQKYFFESVSARDSYFASRPSELVDNLIIGVKTGTYYTLYKYINDGSLPVTPEIPANIQETLDSLQTVVNGKLDGGFLKQVYGNDHDGFQIADVDIDADATDPQHVAVITLYYYNAETKQKRTHSFKFKVSSDFAFYYVSPTGIDAADQGSIEIRKAN
jgi:hypothetical protein